MAKNVLLLCNGLSGSGKSYFIDNFLGKTVYNLKSFTTRGMRAGENWGERYYYVSEQEFDTQPMATRLFVNEALWKPGDKKWLYGVPEFEIQNHLGQNLVYDVIQPRYSRKLIDWFDSHLLDKYYDYKIMWFLPPSNSTQTVSSRANMPNDSQVRQMNTCDAIDFLHAGIMPDYLVKCSAEETRVLLPVHQLITRMGKGGMPVPDVQQIENEYTRRAQMVQNELRAKTK